MKTINPNDQDFMCDVQAPCFQSLDADEIDLLKSSRTQVLFRKGDNITKQGTFASYILFIASGMAIQYIENVYDKSFNLRITQPGEFVGLGSVFSKNTYDYSTRALTNCQAILVEKSALIEIIKQNGTFALGLFQRYSQKNSGLYGNLQSILYKQMNGRMANILLYLNSYKSMVPDIFQLLTRKDIADFAGISTESAVKLLKSFEKEGYISLNGKDIEIIEAKKLEEISRIG